MMNRQMGLLAERYHLSERPASGAGKGGQRADGVRRRPDQDIPLRGIKERLLTLDDTVEFFSLVLGIPLTAAEKQDLVAFLRAL